MKFNKLDSNKITTIISNSNSNQENTEISKCKSLKELFTVNSLQLKELTEFFSSKGNEYLLKVYEKRFIPSRSILAVGIIAGFQELVGVILVMTWSGASVRIAYITTEVVADVLTSYRHVILDNLVCLNMDHENQ